MSLKESARQAIKYYRNKNDLTQSQVAAALGLSLRTVQNYELGEAFPPPDTIDGLAKLFGVPVYKVLGLRTDREERLDAMLAKINRAVQEYEMKR